jgi:DNA-3-methyladenine glycosylase II
VLTLATVKAVLKHLSLDQALAQVLETTPLRLPKTNDDVYLTLLRSIVEQQLSTKAAATIWGRFLERFKTYPHPEMVIAAEVEVLRACGLSYQKAGYLKNIAQFALEQDLSKAYIDGLNDQEALTHLTAIKGVGRWTAEMILMFSLGRPDVFPVDDLIIRNAMIRIYGVTSERKQLHLDLESIAEAWSPYRSYACLVLWDWYEGQVMGRELYGT